MDDYIILGKKRSQWIAEHKILDDVIHTHEVFWSNPKYKFYEMAIKDIELGIADVEDAEARLRRFSPFIKQAFRETTELNGIIESPIKPIPRMKKVLEELFNVEVPGDILLKSDNELPISGSIKARGGFYEVLKYAEELAIGKGLLTTKEDYQILENEKFKKFFSNYTIAVGSTGNLGLSIGIMGASLGFKVKVHMSSDAKQWKKQLLRDKGVTVIEYESDYSHAVAKGRRESENDPNSYFIDDENSQTLFLGYAVAALRVKKQLDNLHIAVDEDHPLFVYLPCGVGGGPGGVAFGLKLLYKDHVHCFFAEPTHSPCMLIGCVTEQHEQVSVQDFGIDNKTAADGLAVGRPSGFVGRTMEQLLSGIFTVDDERLFILLKELADSEKIYLEPSALAGMPGPIMLLKTEMGRKYIKDNNLNKNLENATHIVWATGGSLVPNDEMEKYYQKGLSFCI